MTDSRCKWWLLLMVLGISAPTSADTRSFEILRSQNLQSDSNEASKSCVPLLLEFSSMECGYCDLLEEEILNPLLHNRDYDRRVLMRKLVIDHPGTLIDFDGKSTDAEQLASRYRVYVTPTLLFVDKQGNELAERMIGVNTVELYGGYLDQALDKSKMALEHVCNE